jgi:hypothetical protein
MRVLVFSILASPLLFAGPPREIRTGSLGGRGVIFRDQAPGVFLEPVSGAGDVNGDGLADFLLLWADRDADLKAKVFLVHGETSLPPAPTLLELSARSNVFSLSTPRFSLSDSITGLALAGDLDGDGFGDFFILRENGARAGWPHVGVVPGVVYLVYGSRDLPVEVSLDAPPAGVRITVFTSSKLTTTRLSEDVVVDDLNRDGVADVVFGAGLSEGSQPSSRVGLGRVYVLLGGSPLTGAVDVEEAGRTRPGFILEGDFEGQSFGHTVELAGDVNGDGFGDFLVGAPDFLGGSGSAAYLVYGAAIFPPLLTGRELIARGRGVRFEGRAGASRAGESLGPMGDLNADGFSDFLVASPGAFSERGAIDLVYGRDDFPSELRLATIAVGLGATVVGEENPMSPSLPYSSLAGSSLAVIHGTGSENPDTLIGAPGFEQKGIESSGRVYLVHESALGAGTHLLSQVRSGDLPGDLITTEVKEGLGSTAAAVGDVNGDGHEDFVLAAPYRYAGFDTLAPGVDGNASVYLIYGTDRGPDGLAVERAIPDEASLQGGTEITILGSGFVEGTSVRFGDEPARVLRVETSSRLVVASPRGEALGLVDLTVSRQDGTATRPGGIRYVPKVHADIDVLKFAQTRRGTAINGSIGYFFIDVDGDGMSELVASLKTASESQGVFVLYGRPDPPAEIRLPEPGLNQIPEGLSLLRSPGALPGGSLGDVNGDGHPDFAVLSAGAIHILFGGERYPGDVEISELLREGRGASVLFQGERYSRVAGFNDLLTGKADFDGDGLDDVAVGLKTSQSSGSVYLLRGRKEWPAVEALEDSPHWMSRDPADSFGTAAAIVGDVNGDGRGELLIGTPGIFFRDDGHGYLLFGDPDPGGGFVEDLFAAGGATRFDALKRHDGLGASACAPGDFNGDGIPDLALSALAGGVEFAGESYVLFGGAALETVQQGGAIELKDLAAKCVRVEGDYGYDYAANLAPAGDFNGDGLPDILIGSAAGRGPPRAYVVFGGPARVLKLESLGGEGVRMGGDSSLGVYVAGGGDFNGDGLGDVAIAGDSGIFIVFGEGLEATFIRGDANHNFNVDLSDSIFLLNFLFLGGHAPACDDAADGNDDGRLDIGDAVYLISYLFLGRAAPPPPFTRRGIDPTEDALECGEGEP